MSHGDINRDGKIDGADIVIIESHTSLSTDDKSALIQLSAPTANTSSPRRTIQKPIIFTN